MRPVCLGGPLMGLCSFHPKRRQPSWSPQGSTSVLCSRWTQTGSRVPASVAGRPSPSGGGEGRVSPCRACLVTGACASLPREGGPGKGTPVTCWLSTWAVAQPGGVRGQVGAECWCRGCGCASLQSCWGRRESGVWTFRDTQPGTLCLAGLPPPHLPSGLSVPL